jgi:hypothetical protein
MPSTEPTEFLAVSDALTAFRAIYFDPTLFLPSLTAA